jgi:hypothetical protein
MRLKIRVIRTYERNVQWDLDTPPQI